MSSDIILKHINYKITWASEYSVMHDCSVNRIYVHLCCICISEAEEEVQSWNILIALVDTNYTMNSY